MNGPFQTGIPELLYREFLSYTGSTYNFSTLWCENDTH